MRISELSTRSAVPIPTVKFYLRERLLPPGIPAGHRQAEYGEEHLRRLRLVRILTDVGGMPLRDVRGVVDAIDDESRSLHDALGVAQYALATRETGPAGDELHAATEEVETLIRSRGWHVMPESPARTRLAHALAGLRGLGWPLGVGDLEDYADAADALATREVASVRSSGSRAEAVERMVVGTVVFDSVLSALRRMAQESHSAEA